MASDEHAAEEDMVVREIDVFFTPKIDDDTNLFLIQYPLRPHWRPYGLEERCLEVRIKPEHRKLEVDMVLDTSASYNSDVPSHLQLKKQTLTSSSRSNFNDASYAIGILRENSLYLTPLKEIVQLRHSFEYLNETDTQKKSKINQGKGNAEAEAEGEEKDEKNDIETVQVSIMKRESEEEEQQRLQSYSYLKAKENEEPWLPLAPFANWSAESDMIREKILNSQDYVIHANQTPSQYIESLVPPRSSDVEFLKQTDGTGVLGLSKYYLNTLQLKDKILAILTKGKIQVFSFERILSLMLIDPKDLTLTLKAEVLRILSSTCYSVQGHWVTGSKLFLPKDQCCIRDYILLLFFQRRKIKREELAGLKVPKEILSGFLKSIAKTDGPNCPWEFIHPTDEVFIANFPKVWEDQSDKWMKAQEAIKSRAMTIEISSVIPLKVNAKNPNSAKPKDGESNPSTSATPKNAPGVASSTNVNSASGSATALTKRTLSDQTIASLLMALKHIFLKHEVCSLPFLIQCLKDYAIHISSSKSSTNEEKLCALAAAKALTTPQPELISVVERIATCLHGVYFLTSLGNPTLDPFRQVVVALFRAKGPGNGLRRGDIIEASKLALKTQVTTFVFQKVMKELSYTKGSLWMLKPGDGRPI